MQTMRVVRRLRATNENASSFASKIPTITEPTNDGVLNLTANGVLVAKRIKLWPILLGSENDVSSMRLIGWSKVLLDTLKDLWFPTIIGEWVCTSSATVGIAGAAVLNTERFCDTLVPVAARQRDRVISAGTAINSNYEVLSPVGDLIGNIVLELEGFEKIEATSDQTTQTSTFNLLYAFLD